MKMILCFGIFSAFAFLGWWIHRSFRNRKQFFESLVRFCDHLLMEIGFSRRTIVQIIDTYLDNYSPQFAGVLLQYKTLLDNREDLSRDKLTAWNGLKNAEAQNLTDFLLELGKHSVTEELEKIKTAKSRFEIFRAESTDKLKRDASIYFKICILLGIGVVILIL